MKLKKFFAGVLAAAMMLTVGATAAFADELVLMLPIPASAVRIQCKYVCAG